MSRFRETSELTGLNRKAGTVSPSRPSPRLRRALVSADRAWRAPAAGSTRASSPISIDWATAARRSTPTAGRPGAPNRWPGWLRHHPCRPRRDRPRSAGRSRRDRQGTGPALGGRRARTSWGATISLSKRAATSWHGAARPTASRGGSASRIRPEVRSLAVVRGLDLAVATSSMRVNRWSADGRVVHHLLDPRTGEPANDGVLAVTVAAPDPAWAEVWSKALYHRRPSGDRERGSIARHRGMVGHGRWGARDDAGRPGNDVWVASEAD